MKGPSRTNPLGHVRGFFLEVVTELKKVLWPSKSEVITYSSGVVGVVVSVAALIWILDWAFRSLTTYVLGLYPHA